MLANSESGSNLKGKYLNLYETVACGLKPTDRHIDAVNQLLKDKFPDIQGLATPLLGQTLSFPCYNCFEVAAGFLYAQILHCLANDHWLTLQVQFNEDIIRVFDSVYSHLSFKVKKQMASIISQVPNY